MLPNAVTLAADTSLADGTIISAVLNGKRDDYEILIRRYNSMLYKTARGILTDEADIEDVMQEAYIRGFEKLHQFRSEAKFSTWLTRILINCALQQAAKLKGKQLIDIGKIEEEGYEELSETQNESTDQSSVGENLQHAIEAAIGQISPKYRIVFMLREVEHSSVAETASLLGISEENVKIRLFRAKAMLRDILKASLNSLEIFEFHATRCALMASRVMLALKST